MSATKYHPCHGKRKTWPWKGYPCGNIARYKADDHYYCRVHVAQAGYSGSVVLALQERGKPDEFD